MSTQLQQVRQQIGSSSTLPNPSTGPKRNLGCGILVAAIEDYQSMDEQAHASAAQFLFPSSPEYREHYDWVVAMAGGVSRAWLRDELERAKAGWDQERLDRRLRAKLAAEMKRRLPA